MHCHHLSPLPLNTEVESQIFDGGDMSESVHVSYESYDTYRKITPSNVVSPQNQSMATVLA